MARLRQRGFGIIVYALLALAIVGTIGGIYWRIDSAAFARGSQEVKAEWTAANEAARAREAAASAKAAADLAAERRKRRVVVEERTVHVEREIEKPVYRDICIPDRGLCLLRAAIDGTVEPGCFSDRAVPETKPAD